VPLGDIAQFVIGDDTIEIINEQDQVSVYQPRLIDENVLAAVLGRVSFCEGYSLRHDRRRVLRHR